MAARLWHKAPFTRLLTAFITGIVVQWYLPFAFGVLLACGAVAALFLFVFSFSTLRLRYRFGPANGVVSLLLIAIAGAALLHNKDVRNHHQWVGHQQPAAVVLRIEEPLVEKPASYKAEASFEQAIDNDAVETVTGKALVYFKKDSSRPLLQYGSRILITKPLQLIKNSGNPGGFDYNTYSLFQGITHQYFLSADDYVVLPQTQKSWLKLFLYNTRDWVVKTLRQYISGSKEQGLAEALLIGYKVDLDKNLVEAYSNTGVVHIIAISGLHLGLIYLLLVRLTGPLKHRRSTRWLRLLLIVGSLWAFSLLAGAQPSVLRSAFMFSLIAVGEVISRRGSIINTLAFSAFALLCINPFWLWDVGFQLSYSAVLSIILFYRPIHNWIVFGNIALRFLWSTTAVTLAAQILTTPISIYHFHQMPLLFLFTNLVAVPLSSVILIGEILLCAVFFITPLAKAIGVALHYLIVAMNSTIEYFNSLPVTTWKGLSINLWQMGLLLVAALAICYWLMEHQRRFARTGFAALMLFLFMRHFSFTTADAQQKLIVYNVPKHTAIDVVDGRGYQFIGDSSLLYDDFLRNFHLQPSRILHRMSPVPTQTSLRSFNWAGQRVMVMDEDARFNSSIIKESVDVMVLSKNPKVYLNNLHNAFSIRQLVLDGSVPPWKAALWKRDADSLHIPCYDVAEKGAFVFDGRRRNQ